ncbi:hypothetical protein SAMN02745781_00370 [Vibrio gazogenes DSM 21264]|uniref:Uncharacterized protein n=1 Tax=Vibrio gazogenes DSM 21264 = NBRC 103151 TaxID=1123492 RepID=A0A1M4TQT5_VIBGA|nr:hypothetical protein SAMN02745781_00370 [Vibrio gazogenes DSM 21264] [Vibrio gazogenes DSM 21264 = NBRC 103151]SJN53001.1 hypothetical protein BQ6471_00196 [Vibrio gazogenes]
MHDCFAIGIVRRQQEDQKCAVEFVIIIFALRSKSRFFPSYLRGIDSINMNRRKCFL